MFQIYMYICVLFTCRDYVAPEVIFSELGVVQEVEV